jgi:sulfate adenylyltransferase
MIEPHGGDLVDRVLDDHRAKRIADEVADVPGIELDRSQYQDAINIATGRFSPLTGFLTQNDFLKVVHDMMLEDGTVWPLPIVLDVDAGKAGELTPSKRAGLYGPDGELVGAIDIDEIYKYNTKKTAKQVFGTTDTDHPGVANYAARNDFLVGGDILLFDSHRYNEHDLYPVESRVLFEKWGWDTVVGFQTRNAPHRAHEYIQKSALEHVDGLFIQPKLGEKKIGDYRDEVIYGAYRRLIDNYYRTKSVVLSVFPSKMRYAGPREAVFDALVRKNHGCSHFVIGHDHAGVKDFYDGFDAHGIFDDIGDIGVSPLFYGYAFYCTRCDGMTSEKLCPHGDDDHVLPRGSKIRRLIREGKDPSEKIIRPEVKEFVMGRETPFVTDELATEANAEPQAEAEVDR